MKKLFIVGITAGLLVIPLTMNAESGETATQLPPIAQALVREGDLAIKLVDIFKIGTAENEAEAESMLSSTGIAPRNGWIADYPVTPDIIGELQDAVGEAADSQRLAMGKDEALQQFQDLVAEMGLSFVADTRDQVVQDEPSRDYGEYSRPEVINNYYYNEGPPVITYYPPPWDYYYMYSWIPYPFWCSGSFFRGFFILHDFHRVIHKNKRAFIITNHFRDPKTRKVFAIDPVRRRDRKVFEADRQEIHTREFRSTEAKKGASSIVERNRGRLRSENPVVMRSVRGLVDKNRISSKPSGRPEKPISNNRSESKTSTFDGRNGNLARPPIIERRAGRIPPEAASRDMGERTSSRQRSIESRGITGSSSSAERIDKSFRAPSSGRRGSFEVPQGGGRSGGSGRSNF